MILFHQIFSVQFYDICKKSFASQYSSKPSQDFHIETWAQLICSENSIEASTELLDLSLPRDNLDRRRKQVIDILTEVSSRCKN
jgi:hypothetical protein